MQIAKSGIVVASRPKTDGASCCFPNICVLESGRWLAAYRIGPAKLSRAQRVAVRWSDDGGKSWSESLDPVGPAPEIDGKPGTWRTIACTPLGGKRVAIVICREDASDPLLPFFNEATEGLMDMKLFLAISEDGGETFSSPRQVDCGKYRNAPTPATGPMLVLPDGRWTVQFEVNKHYNEQAPWQHSSAIVFTSDQGKSWSEAIDLHTDPRRELVCWDQRLAVRGETFVAVFWTFDRTTNRYLNIHSRISTDAGQTFGPLSDTGVPGQPARLAMIDDARWVMVYIDRTAAPVVKARLSADRGRSWPSETEIVIHRREPRGQTRDKRSMQDAWAEMSAFSIGLPDAVPLPNGQVLAVYYSGNSPDYTDILWTTLQV